MTAPHKTSTFRLVCRLLALAVMVGLTTVGLTTATTTSASALCASQPMTGDWRNTNTATRSVTRVIVGFHCGDQVLCDEYGNCTGGESYFTLRPFGKCSPTDCDWGTRRAYPQYDGWQRAIYSYSWATKHVWVKTYTYYGRLYLRVWVHTDFTAADGRTDYTTDEWFLK